MDPDQEETDSTIADDLAAIVRLAEAMKAAELKAQAETDAFFKACAERARRLAEGSAKNER